MSRDAGDDAERRVRRYLERRGLRLRQANYHSRRGDIDLVMESGDGQIVFVEVRYRRRADFGGAAASVDARKQRRLIHAAGTYLAEQGLAERPARFDVVAVDGRNRIDWIAGAFDVE